jgi:hypothetical protein
MRLGLLVTVLASFLALAAAQRLPIQIEVRPLFGTTVPPTSCLPLKIVVQNDGPSIDATLVVSPSRVRAERRHLFHLPLPTGSRKEIIALPFVLSNTMSISVRLDRVRGIPEQTISVTPNDNVRLVVAVGDEIGGLEWLRQLNPQPQSPPKPGPAPFLTSGATMPREWVWAYCRPEDLPDKAGALTGVSVLVLGSGSERLTMSQWRAIRRWVMMGGILVVPGGSAAIYLRHIALASLLPIQKPRTVQISDWTPLARWLQVQPPREPAFTTVGTLTDDAQLLCGTENLPLVAVRRYGFGSIVFVAFNLWDKPFRGWQGLPNFWRKSVVPLTNLTVANLWSVWLTPLGEWQGWQRYPMPYAPMTGGTPTQPPPLPFRLELPSVTNIAMTLLAYFVIIVPLSYALLRRRRALDWHWLIAPVSAIAFVFLIGQATLGLHQIGTQNLTRGTVIVAAGEADAYLLAGSTLFIQRAGNYLLDFGEAEGVFSQIHDYYGDMMGGTVLETWDGPTVSTVLRVPNLSFRLLYFAKPITLNGTVDVKLQRQGNNLQVTVINRLPVALKSGQCRLVNQRAASSYEPWRPSVFEFVPISTAQLPALAPQESATVTLPIPPSPSRSPSPRCLLVTAEAEGLDITPSLNAPAQRKSYVTLQVVRGLP